MWLEFVFLAAQVAAMAGVAWLLGRCFLKHRPELTVATGYLSLGIVSVLLLAVVFGFQRPWQLTWIPSPVALNQVSVPQQHTASAESTVPDRDNSRQFDATESTGLSLAQLAAVLSHLQQPPTNETRDFTKLIVMWVVITVVFVWVLRIAVGLWQLLALDRQSLPVSDIRVTQVLAEMAQRLELRTTPRIRESSWVSSPCVTWLQPNVVYVPTGFTQWSLNEQRICLAHEMAHLRGSDPFWRFALQVSEVLWFWNPLCRSLKRQVILAQELVADRTAMGLLENSVNYVCELTRLRLRLNQWAIKQRSGLHVSLLSDGLIRRIEMLQGMQNSLVRTSICWRWFVGMATTLCVSGMGLWSLSLTQGQDNATTPDPVRVAAAEYNTLSSPIVFSRPKTTPWVDYGPQPGYLHVRVASLTRHPLIREQLPLLLRMAEAQLFAKSDGEKPRQLLDFGFQLDAIEHFETATTILRYAVNPAAPDGEKRSISFGAQQTAGGFAFGIRSEREVQWQALLSAVSWGKNDALLQQALQKIVEDAPELASTMQFKPAASQVANSPLLSDTQMAMWQRVEGGLVTSFNRLLNSESFADETAGEPSDKSALKLLQSVESIAFGFDLVPGTELAQIRIALQPKQGTTVKELLEQVDAHLNDYIASLSESQQAKTKPIIEKLGIFPDTNDLARVHCFNEELDGGIYPLHDYTYVSIAGEISLRDLLAN
jgi:beta-lactamase regulating signal transducer with metallopeptidase domain